jgi:peptidoglycan/LPS O-acetylase OafA/YrhL
MAKPRAYIPQLDAIRCIAFLLIFFHHSASLNLFFFDQVKKIGWIGVDIFFCLSAFLLTRLLRHEISETGAINVLHFFVRRILRIWPLYFVYVSVCIVFSLTQGIIATDNWMRAAGLLTFTDNFFTANNDFNPIRFTGHLWTISFEEQFYLLLPFAIPILAKMSATQRARLFLITLFAGFVVRVIFIMMNIKHPAIWVLPVTHFESILFGLALGFRDHNFSWIRPPFYYVAAILSFVIIFLLPGTDVTAFHLMILYPCIGIASVSILCIALKPEEGILNKVLSGNILVFLGKISFGLYVFHNACVFLTEYLFRGSSNILIAGGSLLLTIMVATMSYYFLERRFLRMKKNFTIIPSRPV